MQTYDTGIIIIIIIYLFLGGVGSGWDWYVWRLVTQKMEEGVGTWSLKNNPNYFLISNVLLMIFKVLFGTQTPPYLSTNFLTNQIPIPSPYIPKSITCIYKTSNLHLQDLQHMECKYFITYIFT